MSNSDQALNLTCFYSTKKKRFFFGFIGNVNQLKVTLTT